MAGAWGCTFGTTGLRLRRVGVVFSYTGTCAEAAEGSTTTIALGFRRGVLGSYLWPRGVRLLGWTSPYVLIWLCLGDRLSLYWSKVAFHGETAALEGLIAVCRQNIFFTYDYLIKSPDVDQPVRTGSTCLRSSDRGRIKFLKVFQKGRLELHLVLFYLVYLLS